MGKYNRVSQGEVKRRSSDDFNRQQVKQNPDSQIVRIENAFESFIDRKIWDCVQRKIGSKTVRETRQRRKNPERYLLSGLVVYGCCGGLMHGTLKSKQKNGKRYEWPKYICSTYRKFGNRKKNDDGTGCYYNTIDQNDLLEFLLRKLRQAVLGGENRQKLKDRIRERLESRRNIEPNNVQGLQNELKTLDAEIDRAAERLLTVPENLLELLTPKLQEMKERRDQIAQQFDESKECIKQIDIESETEMAVDRLWTIGEELREAQPARLRELLHRLVSKVELNFTHKKKGKRIENTLASGVIELNAARNFFPAAYVGTTGD